MLIADLLAAALNRRLSAEHLSALARHAGRTIGCRTRRFSINWRIGKDGALAAASPLVEADAVAVAAGGEVQLRGDAKLLRLLSEIGEKTDWAVVVSGVFGPVFAPRLLYLIERGLAAFSAAVQRRVASPAEVADYGGRVGRFRRDVERLSARVEANFAGGGAGGEGGGGEKNTAGAWR